MYVEMEPQIRNLTLLLFLEYSDVMCHSNQFFELSFKMLSIIECSDAIYHSMSFSWLLTCLCIKSPFSIQPTMIICAYDYKIWCWSILGGRISPFPAEIISCAMINIVIRINYKYGSILPRCIPTSICNSCAKNPTSFVNTNIVRPWLPVKTDSGRFWGQDISAGQVRVTPYLDD